MIKGGSIDPSYFSDRRLRICAVIIVYICLHEKSLHLEKMLEVIKYVHNSANLYNRHSMKDPIKAVEWTVKTFEALQKRTDKLILLKEVGLPTEGDIGLSQEAQADYYRLLKQRCSAS